MENNLQGIALTLLILATLVGVLAVARRRRMVGPELSRKLVHMGMGCLAASFPWLFERSWPVGLLAALALIAIGSLRLVPSLNVVLRGIDRQSQGELYFPIAIAFAFHYSEGNPTLYCPPILMLTFGDALAALIGQRFGKLRFTTHDGLKSWEGSGAFFLATFATTLLSLALLSDYSVFKILIVSLLLASLGLMIEGSAWRGLDNLFIPVFGLIALEAFHPLGPGPLLLRLVALALFAGLCFAIKARSTLNDSALLASALILYVVWALQGWAWALAPLLVLLLFTRVVRLEYQKFRDFQSVTSLVGINVTPFFWLAQSLRAEESEPFIWPFASALAIHLSMIWTKRSKTLRESMHVARGLAVLPFVATFCILVVPAAAASGGQVGWPFVKPALVGLLACAAMSAVVLFDRVFEKQTTLAPQEWAFRNLLAFIGSLCVWLAHP